MRISPRDQLRGEALYTSDVLGDQRRGGGLIAYDRTLHERLKGELGMRIAGERVRAGGADPTSVALRGQLQAQLPQNPDFSASAEYEQSVIDARRMAALGAEYRLHAVGRVYGRHEFLSSLTSPYALSLDTTTLTNGSHQISAVARDAAGNTRTSANIAITVDNAQPAVSITQPANNATLSGTTTVTATASDNVAVQSVAFQVDGATVATDTSAPYTLTGETSWLNDGNHTISAVATDTAGNTRTATISVTVGHASRRSAWMRANR